jgi:uncharacterized RDD family membrane protein YckC
VVTPEAVSLALEIAGVGSRLVAAIIDTAIQGAVILLLSLGLFGLGSIGFETDFALIGFVTVFFLVVFAYFPIFEGMWGGRTPGKRVMRLRVVRKDGHPVELSQVAVRNLVRIVDFLPWMYSLGALVMILTSSSQRLGDLAAGTLVIRESPAPAPAPILDQPANRELASRLDTSRMTEQDYAVVRSFLERRSGLVGAARAGLANQLYEGLLTKVGGMEREAGVEPEAYLEAAAYAFRARSSA